LLSGCDLAVLNPKGIIAADQKHLMIIALLLMLIIVIPVIILTFVIAIRYRASNTKAVYAPNWSHNNWLEAVWWFVPMVIIAILATITWITSHKLDPYRPLDSNVKPIVIEAVALQWRWLFIYPDQHVATINYVQFPVNTPVRFLITADAPMNSFQIPQLAGQIYAMAGMETQLNLMANEIGDYNGRSVSFSGDSFSGMTFIAKASSQADFDTWLNTLKQGQQPTLNMINYAEIVKPTEDATPQYFSSVDGDIFHEIIMKYMPPQPNAALSTVAQSNTAQPGTTASSAAQLSASSSSATAPNATQPSATPSNMASTSATAQK
jgi:cytochrome o ubiquinol oxidase subunit 2